MSSSGQNNNHQEAAMDELNLDDLFGTGSAGNDVIRDDGNIDLNLGGMDFEWGERPSSSFGGEFDNSNDISLINAFDDTTTTATQPQPQQPSTNSNSASVSNIDQAPRHRSSKARTARSNPFQQQKQSDSNSSERSPSKSPTSHISKTELNSLGIVKGQILPQNAKRTRRKSKRYADSDSDQDDNKSKDLSLDDEEYSELQTSRRHSKGKGGHGGKGKVGTKGKRGRGRPPKVTLPTHSIIKNDATQTSSQQQRQRQLSPSIAAAVEHQQHHEPKVIHSYQHQHHITGATPQVHSPKHKPLPMLHNNMEQQQQQQRIQERRPSIAQQQQQQQMAQQQQQQRHQLFLLQQKQQQKQIQNSISNYGIQYSRTNFFPYMDTLPNEVDIKGRGSLQKNYPMLYKLSASSIPPSSSQLAHTPGAHSSSSSSVSLSVSGDNSGEQWQKQQQLKQTPNNGNITTESPIYTLFDQHLGALTDNHGEKHDPNELIALLDESTRSMKSLRTATTRSSGAGGSGDNESGYKQKQNREQQRQLVGEMSKLYLLHMKQSAFMRQNLVNIEEYWCASNMIDSSNATKNNNSGNNANNDDAASATSSDSTVRQIFPVSRRHIENVLQLMQIKATQVRAQRDESKRRDEQLRSMQHQQQVQLTSQLQSQQRKLTGGTHGTPRIQIKVKIKGSVGGWRDRSGRHLLAKMWCPPTWNVALQRGRENVKKKKHSLVMAMQEQQRGMMMNVAQRQQHTSSVSSGGSLLSPNGRLKPDVSSMNPATLEAVANELCRFDLLPDSSKRRNSDVDRDAEGGKKKKKKVAISTSSIPTSFTSCVTTEKMAKKGKKKKKEVDITAKKDKKKKKSSSSKKRKLKEGGGAGDETAADKSTDKESTTTKQLSTSTLAPPSPKKIKTIIPYIPSHGDTSHHQPIIQVPSASIKRSISTSTSSPSSSTTTTKKKKDVNVHAHSKEQHRLLQTLHTEIYNPSLLPSERRTVLANEISTSLTRLEAAHNNKGSDSTHSKMMYEKIQSQINKLQSVYKEDCEIVPECCNSIGLWNYMNSSNYFDNTLGSEDDVKAVLKDVIQPVEVDKLDSENDGSRHIDNGYWGSLPQAKECDTAAADDEGGHLSKDGPSPLFDRLQSLLIEVDGGSDESEDDDEDDLISSLPPYSPEEFAHGPNHVKTKSSAERKEGMIDVSHLSLDQRTYIQLRVAGLMGKAPPPPLSGRIITSEHQMPINEEPQISEVLQKMKSHLSSLNVNDQVAILERKALDHIKSFPPASAQKELEK